MNAVGDILESLSVNFLIPVKNIFDIFAPLLDFSPIQYNIVTYSAKQNEFPTKFIFYIVKMN